MKENSGINKAHRLVINRRNVKVLALEDHSVGECQETSPKQSS